MSAVKRVVVERFSGGDFGENGYLLRSPDGNEGVLIDPGAAVEEMLSTVEREGIRVVAILLTHAHIDHVEGVARAKEATGAPIRLHRDAESQYLGVSAQGRWFGLDMAPLPPLDDYLIEGETTSFGDCELTVRSAPGHAPGHVVLVGEGVAMVGDCVFAGSIGRTDLPSGDFQTLMRSIRAAILSLPDDVVLYPGHGPETTVGHERRSNPFLVPQFGGSNFA